jgi:hypothetical protein
MASQDWITLGLIVLGPVLMIVAISLIRSEVKRVSDTTVEDNGGSVCPAANGKAATPAGHMDLADHIETLVKRVKTRG